MYNSADCRFAGPVPGSTRARSEALLGGRAVGLLDVVQRGLHLVVGQHPLPRGHRAYLAGEALSDAVQQLVLGLQVQAATGVVGRQGTVHALAIGLVTGDAILLVDLLAFGQFVTGRRPGSICRGVDRARRIRIGSGRIRVGRGRLRRGRNRRRGSGCRRSGLRFAATGSKEQAHCDRRAHGSSPVELSGGSG